MAKSDLGNVRFALESGDRPLQGSLASIKLHIDRLRVVSPGPAHQPDVAGQLLALLCPRSCWTALGTDRPSLF